MSKPFFQSRGLLLTLVSLCLSLAMSSAAHSQCVRTDTGPPYATAVGCDALTKSTGQNNTAIGVGALNLNTGDGNTAAGRMALFTNSTGKENTAIGYTALVFNQTGDYNTATGANALHYNIGGGSNTATGDSALIANTEGKRNTAIGHEALRTNTTSGNNTAIGYRALKNFQYTNDGGNTAVGLDAGCNLQVGLGNIYIGSYGAERESRVIRIGALNEQGTRSCGDPVAPLAAQTATYIAGIANSTVTDSAVYINSDGRLGIMTSSQRFKKDIRSLDSGGHEVLRLRPVSFRYKQADEKGDYPLQYGLIAEEVAKVLPELVQYDKDGAPLTVRYHLLAPLLLGELQRQHDDIENKLKIELASLQLRAQEQQAKSARQEAENQRLAQEVVALRAQAADQITRMESLERKFTSLQPLHRADAR